MVQNKTKKILELILSDKTFFLSGFKIYLLYSAFVKELLEKPSKTKNTSLKAVINKLPHL